MVSVDVGMALLIGFMLGITVWMLSLHCSGRRDASNDDHDIYWSKR